MQVFSNVDGKPLDLPEFAPLFETMARLDADGCARYVVTDVNKDGMLQGPNLQLLRDVCAVTSAPVIASGGVTTLDDIRALRDRGNLCRRSRPDNRACLAAIALAPVGHVGSRVGGGSDDVKIADDRLQ